MRLLRVGAPGRETPAVLDNDGVLRDARSIVTDYDAAFLETLPNALDPRQVAGLPEMAAGLRIGPPVARPGKIVCVGLNYREHARETGAAEPPEPILFMKAPDTVVGPDDDVLLPLGSEATDYEVELAVVIGTTARYLTDDVDPLRHVAGYVISNDVSERSFQLERGGQWDKGKNCETFNPLGPWLITSDEIRDPQSLELTVGVNGEQRQHSNTADMIFDVAFLVHYISQFMTLYPGDIINTGTPQGVGMGFTPPKYLAPGDVIELSIEGLGTQRQRTRRASREIAS